MDEEIEEKVKALAEKEVERAVDKLRSELADVLEKYVGPGRISPETAAVFLGVSYRSVYRWLGARASRMYLPPIEALPLIENFIERVEGIRAGWTEIVTSWKTTANPDVRAVLYHPRLVAIIEAGLDRQDIEGAVEKLTRKTIMELARRLESTEK
jgi:hypothetical protein